MREWWWSIWNSWKSPSSSALISMVTSIWTSRLLLANGWVALFTKRNGNKLIFHFICRAYNFHLISPSPYRETDPSSMHWRRITCEPTIHGLARHEFPISSVVRASIPVGDSDFSFSQARGDKKIFGDVSTLFLLWPFKGILNGTSKKELF